MTGASSRCSRIIPSLWASTAARAKSSFALAASPGWARRRSASASPARERATYGRARIRIDRSSANSKVSSGVFGPVLHELEQPE